MAASYSCDGCGDAITSPLKVGHFLMRDYCAVCAPKAEGFIGAEESLRRELTEHFDVNRKILIEKFRVDLKALPDTP